MVAVRPLDNSPQSRQDKSPKPVPDAPAEIIYPDSDGEPMAENTWQWDWIALLKQNIDALVPDFVAGDHFWYPVEGRPDIRLAPDVMVCLGRPKGHRGSYMQFREEGVPPAVVIEVMSPGNSAREMSRKSHFYFHYGANEMIVVDPDTHTGWALVKDPGGLVESYDINGWTSPILQIRFIRENGELVVYRPDGQKFLSAEELRARIDEAEKASKEALTRAEQEAARAEQEAARAEQEAARAEQEAARAEQEAARASRLAAKLAALGIDPDSV
jgi:Uma2 family endonuclease